MKAPDCFAALLDDWADDPSVAVTEPGQTYSFARLAAESRAIAGWLHASGFRKGDRFGLWMPNSAAWLVMFLACARAGLTAVALNTRLRSRDLGDILVRSGCRGLLMWPGFAHGEYADILRDCDADALQALRVIVAYGEGEDGAPLAPDTVTGVAVQRFHDLCRYAGDGPACRDPLAGALIVSTSGTTRAPKLALHDQRALLGHAAAVVGAFGIGAQSVLLLVPPLCGVFGFCNALSALSARRPIVLFPRWDAAAAAAAIDRLGVTHLNATDEAVHQLLEQTGRRPVAFPGIRFAGYAAFSPALPDIVRQADERGLTLVGLYGSSELQGLFSRQPESAPADVRARPGGRPVDASVQVRARDPDTGAVLADGKAGELEFFAPGSRMVHYFGDPEATRAAVDDEGWFRSGDLGYTLAGGSFVYLARMGDSLRLGGFLVSAAEIESAIGECAGVLACQVVEVVVSDTRKAAAFVTWSDDYPFDETRVRAHAASRLAGYKVPAHVFRVDAFPVTEGANGQKVQKQELRRLAAACLGGHGAASPAPR